MNIETLLDINKKINPEKAAIINLLYTSNKIFDEMNAITKQFDLSIQQFNVLRILNGAKEKTVNLNYIQSRMIHKMSNTTRLVDKLVERELVSRGICKENRRKVEVKISQKGEKFLSKINNIVDTKEQEFCKNLDINEIEEIQRLLNKLRTNE
ncbi:MAG: MarR family transcriptional regulator [Psychroflexus sp.]|nr:MarR family transcriptional regulator [Psychroflexus sp.]MDR9449494.1 MarR family transcriptional regulator [Psychroflexus sp.]